jgi:hypothetical protein
MAFGVVTAAAAVVAAAPAADEPAPFAFADASALATSCADLADGVEIVVRNETARPAPLTVALGRTTDTDGRVVDVDEVCGGLTVAMTDPTTDAGVVEVAPGREAVVTLRGADEPKGERRFATTLVAYGAAGSVARRTLNVSEAGPDGEEAVPLVASREVAHQRYNPLDEWVAWVPISLPVTKTPALEPGATVGALSGEHGTAAVTYGDEKPKKLTATSSLVPLHIEAVGAGKYTGTIDLTEADDTDETTLTLTAKHWFPLALVPLLAGVVLALVIQWLNGYRLTRARLLDRVADTAQVRADARQRLQEAANGANWGRFDIAENDLESAQSELRREVAERTSNKWVLIDQKIVDDLTGKVEALDKKIGALDTIGKAAPLLVAAIDKLASERPPEADLPPRQGPDLARRRPRLVDAAQTLLEGESLTADELVERAGAIATMTAAVRALCEYDQALRHYWSLAGGLESGLADPADQKDVASLKSRLEGLRHALWDAGSAKVVDSAAAGFDAVRTKIDDLWPRLPDPPPFWHALTRWVLPPVAMGPATLEALSSRMATVRALERPETFLYANLLEEVDLDLSAALAETPVGAPPVAAPPVAPTPPTRPRPPLSAAEAERVIASARTTQWVVVIVAFAVAAITAFSTLYVDHAWGTPWDYLFAIAWATVTQGALTAIAAAIGGLGALAAVRQGLFAPRL